MSARATHERNCPCDECFVGARGAFALTCEARACHENEAARCIFTSVKSDRCGKRLCAKHARRIFGDPYCEEHYLVRQKGR